MTYKGPYRVLTVSVDITWMTFALVNIFTLRGVKLGEARNTVTLVRAFSIDALGVRVTDIFKVAFIYVITDKSVLVG